MLQGLRAAIAVVIPLFAWIGFELAGLQQMAITMAAMVFIVTVVSVALWQASMSGMDMPRRPASLPA